MAFGVTVNSREAPPARGAPTATDTWFPVGTPASGAASGPKLVRSINEYEGNYGQRTGGTLLWDSVDVFFREGGKKAIVTPIPTAGTPADALATLNRNHGPGQISLVGEDDPTVYDDFFQHAADNNRFVIADALDSDVVGDLDGIITSIPAGYESYGAIFGPIVTTPGPRGVSGVTSRNIPASAVIAALCARVDGTGNPNQAAAGRDYALDYATGFKYAFDIPDHEVLLNAGVNMFADVYGTLENYGFVTPDVDDPVFFQANCSRMRMALVAEANSIGEGYMFATLDGRGTVETQLKTELEGMLMRAWQANALFGETAREAFDVQVASPINTPDTIALGELHAAASARLSLHAQAVVLDLITVPVNQAIAA